VLRDLSGKKVSHNLWVFQLVKLNISLLEKLSDVYYDKCHVSGECTLCSKELVKLTKGVNGQPTLLVHCLYYMLPLNHKRTTSSSATPMFYVAKNWQLKDRRFPGSPIHEQHLCNITFFGKKFTHIAVKIASTMWVILNSSCQIH